MFPVLTGVLSKGHFITVVVLDRCVFQQVRFKQVYHFPLDDSPAAPSWVMGGWVGRLDLV